MATAAIIAGVLGALGGIASSAKGPTPPPMSPRTTATPPFVPTAANVDVLHPQTPSPMLRLSEILGPLPASQQDGDEWRILSSLLGGLGGGGLGGGF